MIDPKGNVTHTIYNDPNHETRTYRGWNATTGQTTGPIEIFRQYRPTIGVLTTERTVFNESLTLSATPTTTGSAGSLVPTGLESIATGNIQSLRRELTNDAGQVVQIDQYFSLTGVTYQSTIAMLGSESNDNATGNRHSQRIDYDGRGWLKRVEDSTGTITRYFYEPGTGAVPLRRRQRHHRRCQQRRTSRRTCGIAPAS